MNTNTPVLKNHKKVAITHAISTSSSWGLGSPLATELTNSRRISGPIWAWNWIRTTSSKASFWSGVISEAYLKGGVEMNMMSERRCSFNKTT